MHTFLSTAVVFFLAGAASPQEPHSLQIRHQARALHPGEVVRILVESERAVAHLEGKVLGRTFPFYRTDDSGAWEGLVGIDLDIKAGTYTLRMTGRDGTGKPVSGTYLLAVRAKSFPTRRLTVDEKFVNPPAEVLERIREESRRVSAIFAAVSGERLWDGGFLRPVDAPANSSFGKRSILNGQPRSPHSGTDFDAPAGAPVRSPNAGTVVLADDLYYSGQTVIIDHGLGLYSYFAHLSAIDAREGAAVRFGQQVGKVGATGRVTGPHLHWSVRLAGARVDPLSLIAAVNGDTNSTSR